MSTFITNGLITKVSAAYTRPAADTTTYTAGDALADSTSAPTVLTFSGMARQPGAGGWIVDAVLTVSVAATLLPSAELWLFDTTVTPVNDNVAFTITDAEALTTVAVLPFTVGYKSALNAAMHTDRLMLPYQCAATATALYGLVVIRNAYVPTGSEVWTFRLKVAKD